jgi:superfamily I DNA and RNA helicase
VASRIREDIVVEGLPPEEIIVISLGQSSMEDDFKIIHNLLRSKGIPSITPGIWEERDKFGEEGYVTLSTVYRAKGNEAAVVYVLNFGYLYGYITAIGARNRVFTAMTRAKGWCRVTGVGEKMLRAVAEISRIQSDIPNFIFTFPDMATIRRLSTEEFARRMVEHQKTTELIRQLTERDPGAFEAALESLTEEERRRLRERLREIE